MPRLRASESAARRCRVAAAPTARSTEVARIRQNTARENGSSSLTMKRSRTSSSCARGMAVNIINGIWDMVPAMRGAIARALESLNELRTLCERRSVASECRLRNTALRPAQRMDFRRNAWSHQVAWARAASVSKCWPIWTVPAEFSLFTLVCWNCRINRSQSFGYQLSARLATCCCPP